MDFGATDGPMTDEQIAAVQGNVLHVPTVLGAVVLTYNLPALGATQLKLDGATIADIFLGKITKWNDRAHRRAQPRRRSSPTQDIIVVHRSDGSGTTYIFTDYLSQGVAGVEDQGRRRPRRSTGRSAWAARATRA